MKLYVIRHGQTNTNKHHQVNGRKDSKLTLIGKLQAIKTGIKLTDKKFDLVFSSPLSRAVKTAHLITTGPVIIDPRLIERSYGKFEGIKKKDFPYREYWKYHKNLSDNDVESVKEVVKRAEKLIKDLKKKYSNKTVLLVTHSGFARAIYYYINGIPKNGDLSVLEIPNCHVFEYDL